MPNERGAGEPTLQRPLKCIHLLVRQQDTALTIATDSVLWPLFHYQPGLIKYNDEDWDAYREVNRIFAKKIADRVSDGDLVWVHYYHLMMLPTMLREEILRLNKNIHVGFFLHTAFPCDDMFKVLPVRNELLEGVLRSDLIGFHTNLYAENFMKTCSTLLYVRSSPQIKLLNSMREEN